MLRPDEDDQSLKTLMWLRRVESLPPFPAVVQETLALLDSDRSSASDIGKVVSKDEAITAKILRVVNSAFYGARGRVTTISHAVTLLGFQQLRMVIMGVVLLDKDQSRDPSVTWNRKAIWEHSSASARWAQELALATKYPSAEEASVAGLLHDVGKIVLGTSTPREFTEAVALASTSELASWEAEDRVIGFNHVEAGRMVAERWRFPAIIHETIALHHSPWSLSAPPAELGGTRLKHLVGIVQTANTAAKESLAELPPSDGQELSFPITPQRLSEKAAEIDLLLRM